MLKQRRLDSKWLRVYQGAQEKGCIMMSMVQEGPRTLKHGTRTRPQFSRIGRHCPQASQFDKSPLEMENLEHDSFFAVQVRGIMTPSDAELVRQTGHAGEGRYQG